MLEPTSNKGNKIAMGFSGVNKMQFKFLGGIS